MKSPLRTAFEKLTKPELVVLHAFITDRSKGQTARLFVIESQLAIELKERGAPTSKPEPYVSVKKFQAEIIDKIRTNQDGHTFIAKGTKNAMQNLDSEAFIATVRAHYGVNDFFGDTATEAARSLDEGFFGAALEAIQVLKAKKGKRRIKAGVSKMMIHIETALQIFRERKNPLEKMTKADLRETLRKRLGNKLFGGRSDSWSQFWKRPEIAPFVEQDRKGGRPTTSGKGRAVEAFEVTGRRKTGPGI